MVIELEKERTRKSIGSAIVYCPECGQPLSFRDSTPFCRKKGCVFTEKLEETLKRR